MCLAASGRASSQETRFCGVCQALAVSAGRLTLHCKTDGPGAQPLLRERLGKVYAFCTAFTLCMPSCAARTLVLATVLASRYTSQEANLPKPAPS